MGGVGALGNVGVFRVAKGNCKSSRIVLHALRVDASADERFLHLRTNVAT